ncbi:MAG: winged helix-turn-helix transcriptional regulator [Hyphomicrobiales bacterium]|nr:winged helix-turn-helix transcriptional regulator [Hyphomicrobiales bacterium]
MARPDTREADALISRRILILSNLLRRAAGLRYRRLLDISVGEWGAIAELGARPPCSLNELAASLALDKTRLSRTVSGLVARGLVERRANPDDNRESRLSLTKTGRKAHAEIMKSARSANEALLNGLDAAAREALFVGVDGLIERATVALRAEQARDDV